MVNLDGKWALFPKVDLFVHYFPYLYKDSSSKYLLGLL